MRIFAKAAVVAIGMLVAGPAMAAEMLYTVSGAGSGTIGGQNFSGAFSITTIGDTATRKQCSNSGGPVAGCYFVVNTSAILTIGSLGDFTLNNPSISFVNNAQNLFGFSEIYPPAFGINSFAFVNTDKASALFSTWDGVSDLGPVATNLSLNRALRPVIDTSGGTLAFALPLESSAATFSASLRAGAVPEPATWTMAILGFGMIGAAMRRHRSIRFA